MERIAVLGAGGWGTALATVLAGKGYSVSLWARRPELADTLNLRRENTDYLPGVAIPPSVRATVDLREAVLGRQLIVIAAISSYVRQLACAVSSLIEPNAAVVHGTKGLEPETWLRFSQVLEEELGETVARRVAVISGPNHAEEVGRGMPTAAVIACQDRSLAVELQRIFNCTSLRIYTQADVIGVELCGAVKNVVALATGISDGLGFGDNARAALITRSLAEISRLVQAQGGDASTVVGLAGLGDIVATCTSPHSRNRWAGEQLGRGRSLEQIRASTRMAIEGIAVTSAALVLAERSGVEMPIARQVAAVLFDGRSPRDALMELMTRETTDEI